MSNNVTEFKGKEVYHYTMLEEFYNKCSEFELTRMVSIINGKYEISLRFLNWFITRYCKLYKVMFDINNSLVQCDNYNVNIGYKAQLKSFKKKFFDPFRRKKKFLFAKAPIEIVTTIGQLNFFKWAISYDIINYVTINYKKINEQYEYVNEYFDKRLNSSTTSDEIEVLKETATNAVKEYNWNVENSKRKTNKIILEF